MLLPRFTIRALLVMLTICAFVFVIAGMAVRGQHWAWGITIGIREPCVHVACPCGVVRRGVDARAGAIAEAGKAGTSLGLMRCSRGHQLMRSRAGLPMAIAFSALLFAQMRLHRFRRRRLCLLRTMPQPVVQPNGDFISNAAESCRFRGGRVCTCPSIRVG